MEGGSIPKERSSSTQTRARSADAEATIPQAGPRTRLSTVVREPFCAEAPLPTLDTWITPTDRFFIRSHFAVPAIDSASWRLSIEGKVPRPATFTLSQLREFPRHTIVTTMECAGNSRSFVTPPVTGVPWGNGAVGTARWSGVSLGALVDRVEPNVESGDVVLWGADRGREKGMSGEVQYAMSIPAAKARHPDTLLAFEMNGEPLSPSHGFPVRAIVPGWYGMASVKWLNRIEIIGGRFQGYYRTREYAFVREGDDPQAAAPPVTIQLVKSLITWPGQNDELRTGHHLVKGFAWSGEGMIVRVELSISDESAPPLLRWQEAKLLEPRSPHAWIRWELPIEMVNPGRYVLRVRATDDAGNAQPILAERNVRGVASNSIQSVPITVAHRTA